MLINFSAIVKNICQKKYLIVIYLCSLLLFIYRSFMSDFFASPEPMDIEGEAVGTMEIQLVTAKGEKGVGVDVKRTSSNPEADNLLDSDKGELKDNPKKVIASAPNKFAKTAVEFKSKLNQL